MKTFFKFLFATVLSWLILAGMVIAPAFSILESKTVALFFIRKNRADHRRLSFGRMRLNSKGSYAPQTIQNPKYGTRNSLGIPFYIEGRPFLNSHGDIDTDSMGFQYLRTTLSYIRAKVIEQKFYEVPIADFMPVDVGEAAWSEEIISNLVFQTSGGFFDGDVDQDASRLAGVDARLAPVRMPIRTWAKAANWTIMEIAKAAAAGNWDIVSSKLSSLKKNWDLGIQQVAFFGHPSVTEITGLLNGSEVNINTTLITVPISQMSTTQLTNLVAKIMGAYFSNSNSTSLPNKFVIPTDDFLGLSTPYSPDFPNISRLTYLTDAFKAVTGNANFEILPLAYAMKANNVGAGINKNRYTLYKDDPDTLKLSIPVDLTMLEADTTNKINWQQASYGQYSGVLVTRPLEVLYLDETT